MNVTSLKPNEVFVFGSNLAGRHGKGAAKTAMRWGAKYGKGIGHYGSTYAIPTKDRNIKTLPLSVIQLHVEKFLMYSQQNPKLVFLVTAIGCGLAGYSPRDIAPMFVGYYPNVILPDEFK